MRLTQSVDISKRGDRLFILYDENMNKIDFPKGVTPLDIYISSIEKERVTDVLEGRSGTIDYGSTYTERDVELSLLMQPKDTQDYRLLRNALYATFQINDKFYVSETYEKGKRYLISVDERFIPERPTGNQRWADVEVKCTKQGLPFAESIKTTAGKVDISSEDEDWAFGMGLLDGDDLKYTHAIPSGDFIDVYNAGNVPIHPFEQELIINIHSVEGSREYFALKNNTNGSEFRTKEKVEESDEIVIGMGTIQKNGAQYLRETTKEFIELTTGNNRFSIEGASRATVSFDFRFYYL